MRRFSFLSTIWFYCPRGQPGPAWLRHSGDCDKSLGFHVKDIVSAVIEWGSHPFPSRTRKLSPRSPMVPGPRIRESRSPLDSRPLRGKPRRGLFFACHPGLRAGAGLHRTPRRNIFPRAVTPDLFWGRLTQNSSQKRFPSRCHPGFIPGPACTEPLAVNGLRGFFYA